MPADRAAAPSRDALTDALTDAVTDAVTGTVTEAAPEAPAFVMVGSVDAGFCVEGVCAMPPLGSARDQRDEHDRRR